MTRSVGTLAACAVCVLGGCRHTTTAQDGRSAWYELRTLTTEVGLGARVPAMVSAGEAALRARGYAIERSQATEDRGVVSGSPPDAGIGERVVVRARVIEGGTRVTVTVEPFGGEDRAYAIMDDVLRRVGL